MRIATGVLPAVIALALAGCGGGDDETAETTAAETTKTTQVLKFSDKGRIEQVGNEWAPLFAKDLAAACHYMYGQPLCEKYFGRVGEPPEVRSPSGFQKSFANATVERVEVKGARAGAKFSNGEPVEFVKETGSQAPRRFLGDWFINVGGDAGKKYFEPVSPEQKIEQTIDKWAPLFAAGDRAAEEYQTQPLSERLNCKRSTGPIKNCTPPPTAFWKSFEDATVQDIAIQGDQAGAKLSNGEVVELFHRGRDVQGGVEFAGGWLIDKLGGNAGREFFE